MTAPTIAIAPTAFNPILTASFGFADALGDAPPVVPVAELLVFVPLGRFELSLAITLMLLSCCPFTAYIGIETSRLLMLTMRPRGGSEIPLVTRPSPPSGRAGNTQVRANPSCLISEGTHAGGVVFVAVALAFCSSCVSRLLYCPYPSIS